MKRIVGVYQTGEGQFLDKAKGEMVKYDNIIIWYETDEIPPNMFEHTEGMITYSEKFKRKDVKLLGLNTNDWFELLGREIEFGYSKDKEGKPVISIVFVQDTVFDDKKQTKKES